MPDPSAPSLGLILLLTMQYNLKEFDSHLLDVTALIHWPDRTILTCMYSHVPLAGNSLTISPNISYTIPKWTQTYEIPYSMLFKI